MASHLTSTLFNLYIALLHRHIPKGRECTPHTPATWVLQGRHSPHPRLEEIQGRFSREHSPEKIRCFHTTFCPKSVCMYFQGK